MTIHISLDLETLGTAPGSTILSVGAVVFSPDGLGPTFHKVISRKTCRAAGLTEDPETAEWWRRQSAEAQATLREATSGGEPLGDVLHAFGRWTTWTGSCNKGGPPGVLVYGNGAAFDNALLAAAARACGFAPLWDHRNDRCYRTLRALRPAIEMRRTGTFHNALDDAKSQAEHAVRILDDLGGWE